MKAIIIVVVVIAVMVLLGWLTISRTGDDPSVSLNTDRIQVDAEQAAEATEEVGKKAARESEKLADEVKRTDVDVDVRKEPASVDP